MAMVCTMFESTCKVVRASIGRDAREGQTYTFNQVLVQNIPCSVQESSYKILNYYAQRNQEVHATIFTDRDIGAEPNDIIQVTDRTGLTNNFRVEGLNQPVGRARIWEYYCASMRQAGIAVATNTQGIPS